MSAVDTTQNPLIPPTEVSEQLAENFSPTQSSDPPQVLNSPLYRVTDRIASRGAEPRVEEYQEPNRFA